ncbi:pyridoxine 5'-phosphate synthase [Hugenholtzia roseola]|uniref:pyridoxine 5'-phosphate synthase n=1 Tax=Hugenholtzia roseola TaxID=1002 RepID=UPI0004193EDA|nr:pyridoxine 5'-phosphate synthase [Hugenholtzia roseola]
MTRLSVNINKFATLRNARGGNNPDVLKAALDCERFGAQGITVHPRPDERHIRYADVYAIAPKIGVELNIEGNPQEGKFLNLIQDIRPAQATLVPDATDVLTSNQGWDTLRHADYLKATIEKIKSWGVRVSIFIDPIESHIAGAAQVGADRVELYTEAYAQQFSQDPQKALEPYAKAAKKAQQVGLGLNAGHDLDLHNLSFLVQNIPLIDEVSIGHALVCDALYLGLEKTIQAYLNALAIKS